MCMYMGRLSKFLIAIHTCSRHEEYAETINFQGAGNVNAVKEQWLTCSWRDRRERGVHNALLATPF